jgi:hypothetical protein
MGFLSGLIDSFSGKGAQKGLDKALAGQQELAGKTRETFTQYGTQAGGALRDGAARARPLYAQARGVWDQQRTQPMRANDAYYNTLGLNGAGARSETQGLYESDDILSRLRQQDLIATQRNQNASGRFNSGVGAAADAQVRLRNYGNWQNQLGALGADERGMRERATGAVSSIYGQEAGAETQLGQNLAQNEQWTAGGIAGAYGNEGNAWGQWGQGTAANANTLAQNLIGVGGLALKATGWGGFGAPQGNKLG